MNSTLTEKVLSLQAHPADSALREELTEFCSITIYTYPVKTRVIDREEASDLLLSVYPRIGGILSDFTFRGIPFEIYMKKVSYLQAVSFRKVKRREKRRFVCDTCAQDDLEFYLHTWEKPSVTDTSDPLSWNSDSPLTQEIRKRAASAGPFRNRMIHFILICSEMLKPPQITFLASFLSMEESELARMIHLSTELSLKRIAKSDEKKRIRDIHFTEKQYLEREYDFLTSVDAHPQVIGEVKRKLETQRLHWGNLNEQIRKRPTNVTHAVAAMVTDTPKGTVDSGLQSLFSFLRKRVDAL